MGIDCRDLGRALIIKRNGERVTLSIAETISICQESMESGKEFHEIIKRTIPDVKIIRFLQGVDD